jgi:hypothetical protein
MQSLQSSASTGAGLNRASETSSVGTNGRFFGAYAGSQAGASEAGRRSVSRDFSVAFLLERAVLPSGIARFARKPVSR